jgi:hypothetical protein
MRFMSPSNVPQEITAPIPATRAARVKPVAALRSE